MRRETVTMRKLRKKKILCKWTCKDRRAGRAINVITITIITNIIIVISILGTIVTILISNLPPSRKQDPFSSTSIPLPPSFLVFFFGGGVTGPLAWCVDTADWALLWRWLTKHGRFIARLRQVRSRIVFFCRSLCLQRLSMLLVGIGKCGSGRNIWYGVCEWKKGDNFFNGLKLLCLKKIIFLTRL